MSNRFLVTLVCVFVFSGCGGDGHDDHGHGALSPAEEACEHMQQGPATVVMAGETSDAATDTTQSDWAHKRVDLTLAVDGSGEAFVGYVTYEASTEGDYLVFVDGDATVNIDGTAPESDAEVSECTDVAHLKTFELSVGEHVIEVTASSASVRLVIETAGEESGGHNH